MPVYVTVVDNRGLIIPSMIFPKAFGFLFHHDLYLNIHYLWIWLFRLSLVETFIIAFVYTPFMIPKQDKLKYYNLLCRNWH